MGGTSTIPFLDPTQQQQFVSQMPTQQLLPDQQQQSQPQTPPAAPGPTSGSVQDLENRASQNVDLTSHVLQATQQQNAALQTQLGQAQQQVNDPLNQVASTLSNQYQNLQQQRATGIKGLLQNFIGGMGRSMMREAGLPTPEQQQQQVLSNLISVKNAQAMDAWRNVQTQNAQLVTRTMPSGDTIQLPQSEAGRFDAAQARGQLANQKPDLNDLIGRTVYNAVQQGRDPNQDPVVQQLLQLRNSTQKPPADTAATQKEAFMQGIQPAITANEITPSMMTDVRQLAVGIQNSRAIPAAQKPALISYLLANNTPASQGTQAAVKINLEDQNKPVAVLDTKQNNSLTFLSPSDINARNSVEPGRYIQTGQTAKAGAQVVGFNPDTNQREIRPATDASMLQGAMPVTLTQLEKYNETQRQFNDVQMNVSRYVAANNAYSQLPASTRAKDEAMLNTILDKSGVFDLKLQIGEGGQVAIPGLSNALESASREASNTAYNNMSPQGKDLLNGYLRSMAAVPAYIKALTNTGRSNKEVMDLELANIPNPAMSPSDISRKMRAFQENIDTATQGLPKVPGMQSTREIRQQFEPGFSSSQSPTVPSDVQNLLNSFTFDPASGSIYRQ